MRTHTRLLVAFIADLFARRVDGRRRLTRLGHYGRAFLIISLLVVLPILFGEHGAAGTALASVVLWNPGAQSVFALLGWYPVKLYRAKVDGSTNDSTFAQAAIDAAYAAGGGLVLLSSGTMMANLTIKPKVRILGAGQGISIIKSVAGSNADVIKGLNFATLTGKTKATGDYARGAYGIAIEHVTIDGNKASNSAGYGIRIWGCNPRFDSLEIRSCANDGLWTEFTTVDSFADPTQVLEGGAGEMKIHDCGGNGWTHRGPHDFVVQEYEAWENGGWGVYIHYVAGSYLGGVTFKHVNVYINTLGGIYAGGVSLNIAGGLANTDNTVSSTYPGIEFAAGSGSYKISNFNCTGYDAMIVRGTQHQISVQVTSTNGNANSAIKFDGATFCQVHLLGEGVYPGFLWYVSGSGNAGNQIFAECNTLSAASFLIMAGSGAFNGNDLVFARAAGVNTDTQIWYPNQAAADAITGSVSTINVGGYKPRFPQSNAVMMTADQFAPYTTKGDLFVGSGTRAGARLAAGADDTILVADSAQTLGVKWSATPSLTGLTVTGSGKTALQISSTGADTGLTIGADTNLYRSAADTLKTDDTLVIAVAGGNKSELQLTSTTANTGITVGGDTNLYRSGADAWKTDDSVEIAGSGSGVGAALFISGVSTAPAIAVATQASNTVLRNRLLAADSNPAWKIIGDGTISWGAGGASALDTNLYRAAADRLKTDDSLHVALDFRHLGTNLGFFNHATGTQQTVTGSRGSNAALASLLTALAAYGLVVDSSS